MWLQIGRKHCRDSVSLIGSEITYKYKAFQMFYFCIIYLQKNIIINERVNKFEISMKAVLAFTQDLVF